MPARLTLLVCTLFAALTATAGTPVNPPAVAPGHGFSSVHRDGPYTVWDESYLDRGGFVQEVHAYDRRQQRTILLGRGELPHVSGERVVWYDPAGDPDSPLVLHDLRTGRTSRVPGVRAKGAYLSGDWLVYAEHVTRTSSRAQLNAYNVVTAQRLALGAAFDPPSAKTNRFITMTGNVVTWLDPGGATRSYDLGSAIRKDAPSPASTGEPTSTPSMEATATATPTGEPVATSVSTPTEELTPAPTPTDEAAPTTTPTFGPSATLEPTATATPIGGPIKRRSGIHLGVRPAEDWNEALYARIDGNRGGIWPAALVLLSDQFYDVVRDPVTRRISEVRTGRPLTLDYLRRASLQGVRIVIRIEPSPGNFDARTPRNHRLRLDDLPGFRAAPGCRHWEDGCHRSPADIADHILAIHEYNQVNGIAEWAFEPANEPNLEWYDDSARGIDTSPDQSHAAAWTDMDAYFTLIFKLVNSQEPDIRLLTPPMAQGQYAEGVDTMYPPHCPPQLVDGMTTGYDLMRTTYGVARGGVSWHNYWRAGYEQWGPCEEGGHHVSYYFPDWLKESLRGPFAPVPGFITEADLLSYPWQDPGAPLRDKDMDEGMLAAASIRRFMANEQLAGHMAGWLLNDRTGNPEFAWHEAYRDASPDNQEERPWFAVWWTGPEEWSAPNGQSIYLPLIRP